MNKYSIIIGIISFCLFDSCGEKQEQVTLESPENLEGINVITITENQFLKSGYEISELSSREFPTELKVTGHLDIPRKDHYTISSYIGGVVQDLGLIEGEYVKKGQRLFTLTSIDIVSQQQQYLELRNELEYLKEESERQMLLADENITASKNYKKAKSAVLVVETKLAGLAKNLQLIGINTADLTADKMIDKLSFVSPVSGYVDLLQINNGGYLQASARAMDVYSTRGLHLELKVLEGDISKLKLNQPVDYTVSTFSNKVFHSTVELIEKFVDDKGMVNVHCEVAPQDIPSLSSGMFVNGSIKVAYDSHQALPEDAVVRVGDDYFVLVRSKDDAAIFEKFQVEVGARHQRFVEIQNWESLPANAIFLSKGAYYVLLEE